MTNNAETAIEGVLEAAPATFAAPVSAEAASKIADNNSSNETVHLNGEDKRTRKESAGTADELSSHKHELDVEKARIADRPATATTPTAEDPDSKILHGWKLFAVFSGMLLA